MRPGFVDDDADTRDEMKLFARKRVVKPRNRDEETMQMNLVKMIDAYKRPEVCFFHPATGEKRHLTVGKKLKKMGVKKGVADLMFTIEGRSVAVELKVDADQSTDQEIWQQDFERAGGEYHLARGLDEAIRILVGLNVFRPGIAISSPSDGRGARWGNGVKQHRSPNTLFTSETVTP